MSWCKCGNHGPKAYAEARAENACHICWIQKWHPHAMPPLTREKLSLVVNGKPVPRINHPCVFRSAEPTKMETCKTCRGHVELKVFGCSKHGECTLARSQLSKPNCNDCKDYERIEDHVFCRDSSSQVALRALRGPKHKLPADFHSWNNTAEAFREMLRDWTKNPESPPEFPVPRGITICAGGWRFFPSAYVGIRLLRHHGCKLPIQVWYLDGEYDYRMGELTDPFDVEWVNGSEVSRQKGCRCSGGWELKALAALYSPFREVIALDADSYPMGDPSVILDHPKFNGAFFTPDFHPLRTEQWERFGLRTRKEGTESGQFAVDKSRRWDCLWLAHKLCDHSDYVFRHIYGDKDTFTIAWRLMGQEISRPPVREKMHRCAIMQADLDGKPFFVHRVNDKFKWAEVDGKPVHMGFTSHQQGNSNRYYSSLPFESECHRFSEEGRNLLGPKNTKISVLTAWDNHAAGLEFLLPNKKKYCDLHGYQFLAEKRDSGGYWIKVELIPGFLKDCHWLLWLDMDTVITNLPLKIQTIVDALPGDCDIVASRDRCGINVGVMLMRNTRFTHSVLSRAMAVRGKYGEGQTAEQSAIGDILNGEPKNKWRLSPELASHPSEPGNAWKPGDYVIHAFAGDTNWKAGALRDHFLRESGPS